MALFNPGGTAMILTNKSRVTEKGTDPFGLGQ